MSVNTQSSLLLGAVVEGKVGRASEVVGDVVVAVEHARVELVAVELHEDKCCNISNFFLFS